LHQGCVRSWEAEERWAMVLADATKLGAAREACCMSELAENRETHPPGHGVTGWLDDCGAMRLGDVMKR
jgi:hypothetical protein